jgi:hypothetical protein
VMTGQLSHQLRMDRQLAQTTPAHGTVLRRLPMATASATGLDGHGPMAGAPTVGSALRAVAPDSRIFRISSQP